MKKPVSERAAIQGARIQHAALFRRMAQGGHWDLYAFQGALSGVAIFERSEAPSYPSLVSNVEAMTAETMVSRLSLVMRADQGYRL